MQKLSRLSVASQEDYGIMIDQQAMATDIGIHGAGRISYYILNL